MTDTARLDALEIRIAYQDDIIEELNKALTAQWTEIDRLKRDMSVLTDRLAAAEQSAGAEPGDEPPPPHY
jgi:SlyX protein